jgi:hypothetical protein
MILEKLGMENAKPKVFPRRKLILRIAGNMELLPPSENEVHAS